LSSARAQPGLRQIPDAGLIAIGHAVCTDYANGGDFGLGTGPMRAQRGCSTLGAGAPIIGAATDVYCPGGSPPPPPDNLPHFVPAPPPEPDDDALALDR